MYEPPPNVERPRLFVAQLPLYVFFSYPQSPTTLCFSFELELCFSNVAQRFVSGLENVIAIVLCCTLCRVLQVSRSILWFLAVVAVVLRHRNRSRLVSAYHTKLSESSSSIAIVITMIKFGLDALQSRVNFWVFSVTMCYTYVLICRCLCHRHLIFFVLSIRIRLQCVFCFVLFCSFFSVQLFSFLFSSFRWLLFQTCECVRRRVKHHYYETLWLFSPKIKWFLLLFFLEIIRKENKLRVFSMLSSLWMPFVSNVWPVLQNVTTNSSRSNSVVNSTTLLIGSRRSLSCNRRYLMFPKTSRKLRQTSETKPSKPRRHSKSKQISLSMLYRHRLPHQAVLFKALKTIRQKTPTNA